MAPLGQFEVTKTLLDFLGQSRDSWPFMALLGHVELIKMQKLLESKNKNKNETGKQKQNRKWKQKRNWKTKTKTKMKNKNKNNQCNESIIRLFN